MNNEALTSRLQQFIIHEALSCSMDPGCITPEYVYRMWGGQVPLKDIKEGLRQINANQLKRTNADQPV